MPWKGEKDPYKIWLSEIILQQTRVEQGLDYYNRFIKTFPNINLLANAPEEKVFKMWEGLGYYSRCRNLIASAKYISKKRKGKFPETYDEIKSLKGIGPYTAAAIGSFAFNLPYAVVDGNVFRVLARVFGVSKPIDSTEGKKYFSALAGELIDKKNPGIYNQAIMDFGAVVCKPISPLCSTCVFKKSCSAFKNELTGELPVKKKKISIKKRWFYYFVFICGNEFAIRQRVGKDIWQNLYEFPMVESTKALIQENILQVAGEAGILKVGKPGPVDISPLLRQQLSHQLIMAQFITIRLTKKPALQNWTWVSKSKMNQFAFPGIINQFFQSGENSPVYLKVKTAI